MNTIANTQLTYALATKPKMNKPIPIVSQMNESTGEMTAHTFGLPPDSVGYNKNKAFQLSRKTKMVAKLRAKLNRK
jgi:hypothetical protein